MHEVGITRNIVEIAEEHARREGAAGVRSVTVEIGTLSGVVPEAVEFCFTACARGTLLEGAALHIERVQGRGRCTECGVEVELDPLTFACTACGSFALETLCGRELRVVELEID